MRPTIFGRMKVGIAYVPVFDTPGVRMGISTRSGNILINKGDGSADFLFAPQKNVNLINANSSTSSPDFTYSSNFTGNFTLKVLKGLKDIYSIRLGTLYAPLDPNFNILDGNSFFNQFQNLYSVAFDELISSVLKIDLTMLPNSVENVLINNLQITNGYNHFTLNLSNYSILSSLKKIEFNPADQRFYKNSNVKLLGDLSKLPINCNFFKFPASSIYSAITYTSGKVWASSFDTLYLPFGCGLGVFDYDNIFIDLANSVTTAIGSKQIYLQYRSSASDSAVTYLTGLGYTITCTKLSYTPAKILDLPFQNSFTDVSASVLSIVAGNGTGLPVFVAGPNGTDYAVDFGGTKSIKTSANFPINTSDKISIAFAIKTNASATQVITELSTSFSVNNAFAVFMNTTANTLEFADHNSGDNYVNTPRAVLTSWTDIAIISDRTLNGVDQSKIYVNGLLSFTVRLNNDINGNFGLFQLFIGQRNGSSFGFIGQLAYLKIWNYPISISEVNSSRFINYLPTPPITITKVLLSGDSTITSQACRPDTIASKLFTPTDVSNGYSATNMAVGGNTINQQKTAWNALANKTDFDIIIVQVGLNDMNTAIATTIANYQSYITQINATKKVGAKVYVSCMLPAKQRWIDLGWLNGQTNWVALNQSIMNGGSTPISGVDKRNDYHVSLLSDGSSNLATAYDCGDHIHENQDGADIIIQGFRNMIF